MARKPLRFRLPLRLGLPLRLPLVWLIGCGLAAFGHARTDPAEIAAEGVLFWSESQQLYGYKNIAQLLPVRAVRAGGTPFPLGANLRDLSDVRFRQGRKRFTLASYQREHNVAGLLVVHRGDVVYERYTLGNGPTSRWISFSVAKSVSSMLLGAAIQDGYIKSVDEPVSTYLPQLASSPYGKATIKDVLQMASGVAWNEDYADPESDVARAGGLNALSLYDYLGTLETAHEPGETFNYNSGETNLVGGIVRAAVGNSLASYLEQKIWRPFGMGSDASWTLDPTHEVELGGCCLNATLRDYARIGLFAMADGVLPDGTRVLPEGWMKDSTSPSKGFDGYGYLWWLGDNGVYLALGIFGQMIWIDPANEIVIVTHGAWPKATDETYGATRFAMASAVTGALLAE